MTFKTVDRQVIEISSANSKTEISWVGSPKRKGNPYRVVLFADPLTPGWASRTGGF